MTLASRDTRRRTTVSTGGGPGPTLDGVDFAWTPEQLALRERAREVARGAVERYGRHNDWWINGYSKEFAKELGAPRAGSA